MKKREIITLLKYRKSLESIKRLKVKPYVCLDGTVIKPSKEYLKELELHYGKLSEHLNYLANNQHQIMDINCTHPVLFFVDRKYEKNHRCIFCGQDIDLDDPNTLINLEETIEIEKTATAENHYRPLNNFYEIYSYIMQMLEGKNDDDEIDFKIYFPNGPINNNLKKMILKRNY